MMFNLEKLIKVRLLLYIAMILVFLFDIADEEVFLILSIPLDFQEYYNNGLLILLMVIAALLLTIERRTSRVIREQGKHYRELINISPDTILIYQDQTIAFVNEPGIKMLGASHSKEILGKDLMTFILPKYQQIFNKRLKSLLKSGEILPSQELRMMTIDKKNLFVKVRETLMMFNDKPAVMVVIKNLTKSKVLEERINHITYNDLLTNLPNRRALRDDLDSIISASKKNNHSFAVLCIDIKRFKTINDSLGHATGDIMLKLIAERLKENTEHTTGFYRVGGDEFVIILPKITNESDIQEFCEKMFNKFKTYFKIGRHKLRLLPNAGVALYPKHGLNSEELLKYADIAINYGKKQGNDIQIYDSFMEQEYFDRLIIEEELPKAIDHCELQLQYQPKINTFNNRIIGVEALIRWNSSKLGSVSPHKFIPIAEETELIQSIGEWALRTACRQAKKWELQQGTPLPIAVNVSPRQMEQDNFVQLVAEILKETNLSGSSLQIEITETAMMNYIDGASQTLKELKELGIKIAIDDFGTGFSSLNYLSKLPIDVLKIDRSFVGGLEVHDNQVIAKTVIALGKSLRLEVIAEGVETEKQAKFLQRNGCYYMQGYLFSKPVSAEEVAKMSGYAAVL